MRIFLKKFYRDLMESKGQFMSVLLVVIVGVMFYVGINSSIVNLSESGSKYFEDYRLADLWASVYRAPEGVVKRIETIPGVKAVTGRIVRDVRISLGNREAIVRIITLPDEKRFNVNDIQLKSGSYFSKEAGNQAIISSDFYKANKLYMGQIIEPIINGDRVKLEIVGTAQSPEYVYGIKDGSEMVPDHKSFGVIYVKKSFFQSVMGYKGSIDDISVLLNKGSDIKEVKDEMKKVLNQYGLVNIVERKNQIAYSSFNDSIKSLKGMAAAFPILFFIAAAVIIYITMRRMIENQRTQIGVLKALGYSNFDIMLHYQTYPLLVGILGNIMGSVLGVFIIGKGLADMLAKYYTLPIEVTRIDAGLVLPAAILAVSFCVLAGYTACKKELYLAPAESMKQVAPAAGKNIFMENVKFIWRNIDSIWKIVLKNFFRYKRRSVMASLGIIFSMVLLISAFGLKNSMDATVNVQFSEMQKFDVKINFSKILDNDGLNFIRSMEHVQYIEPVLETGVEISNGWMKKNVGLTALNPGSVLFSVLDEDSKPIRVPDNGILLPERLMSALNLKVGDKAYLRFYYPGENEDKDKKEAVVAGTSLQYSGLSVISSIGYVNYLLKEGLAVNAANIKLDNPVNENDVMQKLKEYQAITTIQSKSDFAENYRKGIEPMNSIVYAMILGAIILAFAAIYSIANINILERRREIATLSVIGFTSKELKSVIFNENYLICAFGIVLGLPLGRLMAEYMLNMTNTDTMYTPLVLSTSSYIISVLLVVIFTMMANTLLAKKILSIDMVESLKSRE